MVHKCNKMVKKLGGIQEAFFHDLWCERFTNYGPVQSAIIEPVM